MRDYLNLILANSGTLTFEEIVMHILLSAIISIMIYISYWYTHTGTNYSKKFNVSLVTLTILTGTVMTVIGNNIALSLGMVGALSIVRFRTAIKDSRDTTYIFWAIIVGICCGVGDYTVASIGSLVVFVILLLLGRVRNDNRFLLIIKARNEHNLEIEKTVSQYFGNKAVLKVKNTTKNQLEYIYELTRNVYDKAHYNEKSIMDSLYELSNVEYVNVVSQSDEING